MYRCRFRLELFSVSDLGVRKVEIYERQLELPFAPAIGHEFGPRNSISGRVTLVRWDTEQMYFEVEFNSCGADNIDDVQFIRSELLREKFQLVETHIPVFPVG